MSRTKRGSKGPGYDYWSRRPHSGNGHGPEVKRLCHSVERQQAKGQVTDGLSDSDTMLTDDVSTYPAR